MRSRKVSLLVVFVGLMALLVMLWLSGAPALLRGRGYTDAPTQDAQSGASSESASEERRHRDRFAIRLNRDRPERGQRFPSDEPRARVSLGRLMRLIGFWRTKTKVWKKCLKTPVILPLSHLRAV